jgi:hypothetical protein
VKYLGKKGIDASRVATGTSSGEAGAEDQNQRVNVIWFPEVETYQSAPLILFSSSVSSQEARAHRARYVSSNA